MRRTFLSLATVVLALPILSMSLFPVGTPVVSVPVIYAETPQTYFTKSDTMGPLGQIWKPEVSSFDSIAIISVWSTGAYEIIAPGDGIVPIKAGSTWACAQPDTSILAWGLAESQPPMANLELRLLMEQTGKFPALDSVARKHTNSKRICSVFTSTKDAG